MFRQLNCLQLLRYTTIFAFLKAIVTEGINLCTLLAWIAHRYPNKTVISTPNELLTYSDLYKKTQASTRFLQNKFFIKKHSKVAILCGNNAAFVSSVFAASRLGAEVYLLNVEMSAAQLSDLYHRFSFDLLLYDEASFSLLKKAFYTGEICDMTAKSVQKEIENAENSYIMPVYTSKLIVLSGGTTGNFKTAGRKPSLFTFLNPFLSLIKHLDLLPFTKVYIAVPFYHGYGLATLLFSMSVAAEIHLLPRFEVAAAAKLIQKERIQVLVVVPLILHKLLETKLLDKVNMLNLQAIVSGGAALLPVLVQKTQRILGHKLYNLYGTSEVGFALLATPIDLQNYPDTLGKPIFGVKMSILTKDNQQLLAGEIGEIGIKSRLAMLGLVDEWAKTGDLGYQNAEGYCFLCGRVDDMIVSAGENVYPFAVERVLASHSAVAEVAVIGVNDEVFGQRLQAFIVLRPSNEIDEFALLQWLKPQIARFELPKKIVFLPSLPYTSLGKPDKNSLKNGEI